MPRAAEGEAAMVTRPANIHQVQGALALAGIPSNLWRVSMREAPPVPANARPMPTVPVIIVSTREHQFPIDPRVGVVRAGRAAVDQVRRALSGHTPGGISCPFCNGGGLYGPA